MFHRLKQMTSDHTKELMEFAMLCEEGNKDMFNAVAAYRGGGRDDNASKIARNILALREERANKAKEKEQAKAAKEKAAKQRAEERAAKKAAKKAKKAKKDKKDKKRERGEAPSSEGKKSKKSG